MYGLLGSKHLFKRDRCLGFFKGCYQSKPSPNVIREITSISTTESPAGLVAPSRHYRPRSGHHSSSRYATDWVGIGVGARVRDGLCTAIIFPGASPIMYEEESVLSSPVSDSISAS